MDRLISEKKAIEAINDYWGEMETPTIDGYINAIKAIPSAEPRYYPPCEDCHKKMNEIRKAYDKIQSAEPKTGHWIKMPLVEAGQTYSHKCSLCGRRILITDVGLSEFPYCHCGARMVEP